MPTPRKPPAALHVLVIAAFALLGAGCTFQQKTGLRIQSFEPYKNHRIGDADIREFLSARTAVLIISDSLPTKKAEDASRSANFRAGCAAAIDPRGYFLTAAHCIGDKPVYFVFPGPDNVARAQRARVVWRSNVERGEPDLAILHVVGKFDEVFEWSEAPGKNDPVMAVGLALSWKERVFQGHQHMGGRVLDLEKRKGNARSSIVHHDIPIQSGDSGGPLLNAEARLIGINVRSWPPIVRLLLPTAHYPRCEAERPDPAWLADIIEKDAATPRPAATVEIFEL